MRAVGAAESCLVRRAGACRFMLSGAAMGSLPTRPSPMAICWRSLVMWVAERICLFHADPRKGAPFTPRRPSISGTRRLSSFAVIFFGGASDIWLWRIAGHPDGGAVAQQFRSQPHARPPNRRPLDLGILEIARHRHLIFRKVLQPVARQVAAAGIADQHIVPLRLGLGSQAKTPAPPGPSRRTGRRRG